MFDVEKATDASGEEAKRYEQAILDLARATGKTKEELGALLAAAGFAGRPVKELAQFTEYAAKAMAITLAAKTLSFIPVMMGNAK